MCCRGKHSAGCCSRSNYFYSYSHPTDPFLGFFFFKSPHQQIWLCLLVLSVASRRLEQLSPSPQWSWSQLLRDGRLEYLHLCLSKWSLSQFSWLPALHLDLSGGQLGQLRLHWEGMPLRLIFKEWTGEAVGAAWWGDSQIPTPPCHSGDVIPWTAALAISESL